MVFDDALLLFMATDELTGAFDVRDDDATPAAAAAAAALVFVVIDD